MNVHFLPSPGGYEQAYAQSFNLAFDRLSNLDPEVVLRHTGATGRDRQTIKLDFIGIDVAVNIRQRTVESAQRALSMTERLIVLHYLVTADGTTPTGKLISFKELPGGSFYLHTFQKRTVSPVLTRFRNNLQELLTVAEALGGKPVALGDAAVCIRALPRVVLYWILWRGDSDFEAESTVLFDSSIVNYLPTEDITVLCQTIATNLLSLSAG